MNTTPPPDPTPDSILLPELSFLKPRQCRKDEVGTPTAAPPEGIETLGFTDEPNPVQRGFPKVVPEIGSEALYLFTYAGETDFALPFTYPPFRDQMRGFLQAIETTWVRMKPSVELLAKIERESNGNPIHPKDIRDERGVKHPSTVPPFWAARPNGRRR